MIEVKGNLTAAQTDNSYCASCSCKIEDGSIIEVGYNGAIAKNTFQLCHACATELSQGLYPFRR
jgi:hypothetical protein